MLDARSRAVLWAIVQSYIDRLDPVGSRYITRRYEFGVSPATIRNIMADLEDMGFLRQPHTSAGRVPTDKGYRFYVEALMEGMQTENLEVSDQVMGHLGEKSRDIEGLLRETTRVIADFSHYIAVACAPRSEEYLFQKIQFVGCKDNRVAVIMITEEGMIRHSMIDNDLGLGAEDLRRYSDYINDRFSGMSLRDLRVRLVEEIRKDKDAFDALMRKALSIFEQSGMSPEGGVFISGFQEVVHLPDFSDVSRIKELSRTIEDRHAMIRLLDRFAQDSGVRVMIGEENPIESMWGLSVVTSTFRESERAGGVIGIIGPKRMNYQSAIAIVDTAARYISRVLTEK